MALHTILGANGTIANVLLPVLQEHNENIRLVSRNPKPVNGAETIKANLLDREAVVNAVKGSAIVYLLVGITYEAKIWQKEWPVIMKNVIEACKLAGAKLVFFDNIYMYGKVDGIITETTPYHPISKKGVVRANIARMLEEEMQSGKLQALIARAADFYGPGATDKSAPGIYVFSNLKKGKKAFWPVNANVARSFNYTPDAARALYMLATHEQSFGQVWHLPCVQPALTGKAFVAMAATYMHTSAKVFVLPRWVLKIASWFNPSIKEIYEMLYQDEFPFRFSSAKFEKAFNFTPTPYETGIQVTAEWFRQH
jgi:nucleoside-diphosphate-sugar epimerase